MKSGHRCKDHNRHMADVNEPLICYDPCVSIQISCLLTMFWNLFSIVS